MSLGGSQCQLPHHKLTLYFALIGQPNRVAENSLGQGTELPHGPERQLPGQGEAAGRAGGLGKLPCCCPRIIKGLVPRVA